MNLLEAHQNKIDINAVRASWEQRAKSAVRLRELFADANAVTLLAQEIAVYLNEFFEHFAMDVSGSVIDRASSYLVEQLASSTKIFIQSRYAQELLAAFDRTLDAESISQFKKSISDLKTQPDQQWALASTWLNAVVQKQELGQLQRYIPEAAGNLISAIKLDTSSSKLELEVSDLLGEHITIESQTLAFSVDEYLQKMHHHHTVTLPEYDDYLELRSQVMRTERSTLKLESFKAKPLSSFVRNRLVNESYLPLICLLYTSPSPGDRQKSRMPSSD